LLAAIHRLRVLTLRAGRILALIVGLLPLWRE